MTQFCKTYSRADRQTAACIKGMLTRGDALEDIAAWFGLKMSEVRAVQSGAVHPFVEVAPAHVLPPAGPYPRDTLVYHALAAVDEAERSLSRAAGRLRRGYRF